MTSAELEPVKPATLTERMDYARALAAAGLLPDVYRDKPANVLYAVEYGAALGVAPMTAIMGIHVIQGKPTLSADLMAALIRRAGHRLRVHVEDGPVAVAELTRHDDPEYTFRARWDLERAKNAGLLGKDNWKHHPAAMLKARAISEVAREYCSEVLNGLIYTPEEMGANTDEDGAPIVDGHVVEDQPKTAPKLTGSPPKGWTPIRVYPGTPNEDIYQVEYENSAAFTAATTSGGMDVFEAAKRWGHSIGQPPVSVASEDQVELPDAFPDDTKQEKP